MKKLDIIKLVEVSDRRSAWCRGRIVYARELLDGVTDEDLRECAMLGGTEGWQKLEKLLLNGADNWSEYSWGGCALIYDSDIAERLCCPSELKKTRNGARRPNSREEWLDTQARALRQAARLVWSATKAAYQND